MITKISSFVGERDIPNTNNSEVASKVEDFIKKYEPEAIRKLLGYSLFTLFNAENPIITGSRFDKLLNGVEYVTDWNTTERWVGFKSLLVDYIYYWYMRSDSTKNSGKGTIIPKADAAANVSPAIKMIDAWNSFVRGARLLNQYMLANSVFETYPEFTFWDAVETENLETQNEFDI